jgi:hypothetical protein
VIIPLAEIICIDLAKMVDALKATLKTTEKRLLKKKLSGSLGGFNSHQMRDTFLGKEVLRKDMQKVMQKGNAKAERYLSYVLCQ